MLWSNMEDIEKQLFDAHIREMNAEIDRDTILRYTRGERIIQTQHGPVWTYLVDANNKVVDEKGFLLDNNGQPTAQRGSFN